MCVSRKVSVDLFIVAIEDAVAAILPDAIEQVNWHLSMLHWCGNLLLHNLFAIGCRA
jgi:uncharacterized protein YdhG (YjbR/CyaY superfamily)